MPTTMTPTITTRKKKRFPSQQYTGMCFLTVSISGCFRVGDFRSKLLQNMRPTYLIVTSRAPNERSTCSKLLMFCVSSWLITEINILRCTASKTSKKKNFIFIFIKRANYLHFCYVFARKNENKKNLFIKLVNN